MQSAIEKAEAEFTAASDQIKELQFGNKLPIYFAEGRLANMVQDPNTFIQRAKQTGKRAFPEFLMSEEDLLQKANSLQPKRLKTDDH